MKTAAGRRIHGTRNLALQKLCLIISFPWIRNRNGVEQEPGIGMHRSPVDLFCSACLAQLSKKHDGYPVGKMPHHRKIMTDKQVRQAPGLLELLQKIQDLVLDRNVQSRNRLVTDDQSRIDGQRPGNADPLPLSSGKLVGIAVKELSRNSCCLHKLQDLPVQVFL